MSRKGTRKSREATRNLPSGNHVNPTGMRRGSLVHRPTADHRPLCGWFEAGIVYTYRPVTCELCQDAPPAAAYSSTSIGDAR